MGKRCLSPFSVPTPLPFTGIQHNSAEDFLPLWIGCTTLEGVGDGTIELLDFGR